MLCHCFQVTRDTVREAILNNRLETVEDVTNYTKAGGGCGDCHGEIGELLAETWQAIRARDEGSEQKPVVQLLNGVADASDQQRAEEAETLARIQEVLTNDIAVALRNDGGDIELVRYRDGKVFVRLTGNCAACRVSDVTISDYVQEQLRQLVREDLQVVEVKT
jgi:NifU-like protein